MLPLSEQAVRALQRLAKGGELLPLGGKDIQDLWNQGLVDMRYFGTIGFFIITDAGMIRAELGIVSVASNQRYYTTEDGRVGIGSPTDIEQLT